MHIVGNMEEIIYHPMSAAFGTFYQLRNLINRCSVIIHPKRMLMQLKIFLPCMVVTSHFIAACMKRLGMESLDDIPKTGAFNANTWMMPDADRRTALYSLYSFCQW